MRRGRAPRPAAAAPPLARRADLEAPTVSLTREGRIYLGFTGIFSLTAFVLGDNLVFLMGCLLLGSAVIARRIAAKNLVGLWVDRRLPSRLRVGHAGTLRWTLGGKPGTSATGVEVRDRTLRSARPRQVSIDVPHTRSHDPATCSTSIVFSRRGRMRLGPVVVESRFPIGMFRASSKAAVRSEVIVWPREGRPAQRLFELLRGEALAKEQRAQGDDMFYGVRELREGDDPRRIHWRSSARRGALVVSQWRMESGREIWIVLGRGRTSGAGCESDFERAVSAAATVWREAVGLQLDVRLVLGANREQIHSQGGRRLQLGLDALATVVRFRGRRPHAALKQMESRAARPRSVVYVASKPDPSVEARAVHRGRAQWHVLPAHQPKTLRAWIRGLT